MGEGECTSKHWKRSKANRAKNKQSKKKRTVPKHNSNTRNRLKTTKKDWNAYNTNQKGGGLGTDNLRGI